MSFLSAEWRKLAIANYSIDKAILKKYIPYKTELDIWQDICYVSLVGFMFVNTKMLGMKIPFHANFEEVNLRFYVRYKDNNAWKRGVVFIKELVPKSALAFIANSFYKENYQTVPMNHSWVEQDNSLEVEYNWMYNNRKQGIWVRTENNPADIPVESETEFITEHYWGYTKIDENRTFEYEVTHLKWQAYPVIDYRIDVDFGMVYGSDFEFINRLNPVSVILAEGSGITVESKKELYKNF